MFPCIWVLLPGFIISESDIVGNRFEGSTFLFLFIKFLLQLTSDSKLTKLVVLTFQNGCKTRWLMSIMFIVVVLKTELL